MDFNKLIEFFSDITFLQGFTASLLASVVIGIALFLYNHIRRMVKSVTVLEPVDSKIENNSISQSQSLIGWAEINKAIEGLIIHEEGFRFQRLAISLAKKRWPELVTTNIHKDGGEDAFALSHLTENGIRFDVACSLTAEYGKIEGDIKRLTGRGIKPDFLVFYTPVKVSNDPTIQKWQTQLRQDYDCDLIVISREDLIQELIKPENKWICREFLGLPIKSSPDIDTTITRGIGAASKIIEGWKQQIRSDPNKLINIEANSIDDKSKPTDQCFDPSGIAQLIAECRRVILKGSPGSGKTTTLIQIAKQLIKEHKKIPILISLSDWAESQDDLLTFICKHPAFLAVNITTSDMAILHENGCLTFLFNGWNEVNSKFLEKIGLQLQKISIEFTAAGLIVTSREHYATPPFIDSLKLVLQPLNDSQRRTYIKSEVAKDSNELIDKIETSKTLNSITRTPLFLSETVRIFNNGYQIPDSKYGILQSTIVRIEQIPEHSTSLNTDPLSGRASQYLSALAFAMTKNGQVGMHYDEGLKVVNNVNKQLHTNGHIVTIPEPHLIVDALCAHHLLEQIIYPIKTIYFVHQQFQEFYAATMLRKQLAELCISGSGEAVSPFQKDVINIPIWEEPLKILTEDVGGLIANKAKLAPFEIDALTMGKQIVKWAISVDPVFAAKLVGILGEVVWKEVKSEFEPLLRKWYESKNSDHRECALAAIFATGSSDFSDIIWPLLEHTKQQVRLSTYQVGGTFNLSCLGSNWRERIRKWEEERRAEFINELSIKGQSNALEIFEDFSRNDPSPRVRANAINSIDWYGGRDKMWQVLKESNDETFKVIVQHQFLSRKIPSDLLPRIKVTYQQLLSETKELHQRLKILLYMSDLNGPEDVALLKAEVENYPIQPRSDLRSSNLRNAITKIASCDPEWASEFVVRKQTEGKLCDEHWSFFITKVPNEIIDGVIQELLKSDCQDRRIYDVKYLINKGATREHAHTIIQKLIELNYQIKGHYLKDSSEMYHRLKEAAYSITWQTLAEAFLEDYSELENELLMEIILDLAGLGALEQNKKQSEIKNDTLGKFRILLRSYAEKVLKADDYSGRLKAELSCALAVFGEISDVALILKLINADIERIHKGQNIRLNGDRTHPLVQGASTRWDNWHIRALCRLDPDKAEMYLLNLLNEPDYEEEASLGLVRLLKRNVPQEQISWGHKPLKIGASIQERNHIDTSESKKYSSAIEKCIRDRIVEGKKNGRPRYIGRSIITLAQIGEPESVHIVLEVLQVPIEYGAWTKLDILEALIRNGHKIDSKIVELIIDEIISQISKGNYNDQNEFLLGRCCSILACTEDKPRAIVKIKQLLLKYRLGYNLREVIETIGYTNSPEAANFLIELSQNSNFSARFGRELLHALSNLDVPESKQAILSIVDPTIQNPQLTFSNKNNEMSIVAETLTNWAQKDEQLKKRIFELCSMELTKEQREVLSDVVNRLATNDAVYAGLNLISDQCRNPIPFYLKEAIENSVTVSSPLKDIPTAYNVKPCENAIIKEKLFDMVYDDHNRSNSAYNLLGFIYKLRLEHGNPPMEPRHPNIKRKESWPL